MAPLGETRGEVFAGDELHHECDGLLGQAMDLRDVGMVERCERRGFTLEAGEPIGIAGDERGKHLERDVALQPRVAGAVDLAHAACTNRLQDLIGPDGHAGQQAHACEV